MDDPTQRHRNLALLATILGLNPVSKGKKSKTKCQQKRKRSSVRDLLQKPEPGYTLRQVSRFKFIRTDNPPSIVEINGRDIFAETITKDSNIGRRFAR